MAFARSKALLMLEQLAKRPLRNSSSPFLGSLISVRHASHGAAGIANGPKNGPGKRLGAKKGSDEWVIPGNIIFRQRGTKWFPGENVGLGRDHTLYAKEHGYVRFYKDPRLHKGRQYIGVVLEKHHTLPTPVDAPRRRRLNMEAIPRKPNALPSPGLELGDEATHGNEIGIIGDAATTDRLEVVQAAVKPTREERAALRAVQKRQASGRLPIEELEIRPDYSYREANWQIGRAPERAGVTVKMFDRKDRWVAYRKRKKRMAKKMATRVIRPKAKERKKTTNYRRTEKR